MSSAPDPFEGVFRRGIALGHADVKRDEITFRFRKELFTFPTLACMHFARYNGHWYEAKIAALRKLSKDKH